MRPGKRPLDKLLLPLGTPVPRLAENPYHLADLNREPELLLELFRNSIEILLAARINARGSDELPLFPGQDDNTH